MSPVSMTRTHASHPMRAQGRSVPLVSFVALATLSTVAACAPRARNGDTRPPSPVVAALPPVRGVPVSAPEPGSPAAMARADGGIPPYTPADVAFMQGMIGHHAQAVTMAGMVPRNGAGKELSILAERIAVAQGDEIAFMSRWLRDRKQQVPDVAASPPAGAAAHDHAAMSGTSGMPGMSGMSGHDVNAMPGMLTPAQLSQLEAARGGEFESLFLQFMIRHHEGALVMVDRLFGSRGAGQDDDVFKFASDVTADQTTEIARMREMLKARGVR